MVKQIKNIFQAAVNFLIKTNNRTAAGRYISETIVNSTMERNTEIFHNGTKMILAVPNSLCTWRAKTFSTKEPETLEWIDSINENSMFWDVGANVGLYSLYAAKKKHCKVWCFEPSVFNVELLARNSYLNGLTENICLVPIALSDRSEDSKMQLTTKAWGGALSTFGKDFGWDGQEIKKVFEYRTLGISMDDAVSLLKIPSPDYIKIDVDGLEHFILKGGSSVMQSVKEILIEVNDDFLAQADQCNALLSQAGLKLKSKLQSNTTANSQHGFQNSFNQIWTR
jgi:FkbM family methyltransferase